MLVKDCMTRHPIMISDVLPATKAQKIMVENKIRHIPVVGDGKRLEGLLTRRQLTLKPEELNSLNVWEITRKLSNLKVKDLMHKKKDVFTIDVDKTVERAAHVLSENKISCLPVIENGGIVIGILTETDLLGAFQEMLGLPAEGVRVTVRMPDHQKGEFAKIAAVIVEKGWGIMGIGSFPSHRNPGYYDLVLKLPRLSMEDVQDALGNIPGQTIVDIRESV